ncbi:MAG TPA: hypothetical protein VMU80_26265 [Bryobacteraceae bacterium]|nr:hypothetical protein [Bryobacteraceae bacterium]HUO32746.1 hypothetical protein [Bryobacteraceae bacterium]
MAVENSPLHQQFDEHAYTGGYTIVKDYVRLRKLSQREMFALLAHPAGDAQADFGEAMVKGSCARMNALAQFD